MRKRKLMHQGGRNVEKRKSIPNRKPAQGVKDAVRRKERGVQGTKRPESVPVGSNRIRHWN